MPILYHHAAVAHSAKALIVLAEKDVSFESRRIEVPVVGPDVVRSASQAGSLPLLVDNDGTKVAESSVIAEYLEETRPAPALMPADAVGRWRARVWFKFVNEDLAPAVGILAWSAWGLPALDAQARSALADRVKGAALAVERQAFWLEGLAGFSQQRTELAHGKIHGMVKLLEQCLEQSAYLAGPTYSLADIDVWPFVEPLPRLLPSLLSEANTPRLLLWLRRVGDRPAVARVTGGSRDLDWTLGPEPIRWG